MENINNHIKKKKFLSLRYFIMFSFLFSILIVIIDALMNYLLFYNSETGYIIIPPVSSPYFYNRLMIIVTYMLFGIILYFFFKKNYLDEQSIIESELRFKMIANYTKDWEYWLSNERELNFISPSCKNITGYTQQEFYKNPQLINEIVHKDDKELFISHETKALDGNEVESIEFRIVTKDNRIIWIDHSCQSVFDNDGHYVGHRVSNRNITSRKEIEVKLRDTTKQLEKEIDFNNLELEAIISQSPYAKAVFDKKGTVIRTNDNWDKLFKNDSKINNISKLAELDDEHFSNNVITILNKGGFFKSDPIYFEQLDKILQLTMYDIKNLNGKTEKIVCNIEDITDQIRRLDADRELKSQRIVSKKIFAFLEDERKRISKELHDQIGQKLMLIKLNVELLRNSLPGSKEKIEEIIQLLLSINREIKEIVYSLHPAELENYGLIAALDSMVNRCANIGWYTATINIYGEYTPMEKEIELGIYRICQEIVSNITKHSQATEAEFQFHFQPDKFIGIISDNGIGFNTHEYGMNNNNHRSFGLISVQERAKVLNGFLEIESKIDEGTKVYFQIPLKENANGKD